MKRVFVYIALTIGLISACSPKAQPTDLPDVIDEQATHISTDITPAQRVAVSTVAKNLGVTPDKIRLVSTEAVDWPDSCLGITVEGISCAQVITPGFRVILEVDGNRVEYHTNQDGTVIHPATVAMTWKRSGGFAGFCDSLTIYLSGEVQGSSCKNVDVVEAPLADLLSAEEIASLNKWISTYDVVNLDASDPKGVADAMSMKLQLNGSGTEQTVSPESQQNLLQFAQSLYQKLMSQ